MGLFRKSEKKKTRKLKKPTELLEYYLKQVKAFAEKNHLEVVDIKHDTHYSMDDTLEVEFKIVDYPEVPLEEERKEGQQSASAGQVSAGTE